MFQTFFYKPVVNLLIFLYDIIPGHDIGLTILIFVVIVKIVLYPLQKKAITSQKALQEIQPEIEELKKKYKDDKQELGKATLELYKEKKINPFSSCLPLLIQLPFLIAIFRLFRTGFTDNNIFNLTYSFVSAPETINPITLGFVDLSQPGNILLSVLAGGALYVQTKMMMARKPEQKKNPNPNETENMMNIMNKQMLYMMPVFVAYISYTTPSGLALYWFVFTSLTVVQQYFLFKKRDEDSIEVIKKQN